ncbi:MAG TPA: nicotinate (nicotinamide) nucleotide adenylyltransferase [Candidatus Limnocylindrales bacterium]|nr:nicotinate (nicotinamide) nucleotide adenylyltransferase [Candidatus Limnocylindrales bacterium]
MHGGTFDPVHIGHLTSARELAAAFDLQKVLMVVSANPPHKPQEQAPAELRLAMLEAAVRGDPVLEPCGIELGRHGPSYTVDTIAQIAREHSDAELFLSMGIDAYEEIDTWSRPHELLELCNIIVTSRPGCEFSEKALRPPVAAHQDGCYDPAIGCFVHKSGHVIVGHRITGVEASSSEVRRRVRLGLPFEGLTGFAVARIIREHCLYGAPAHTTC